ncbi:MAG: ATP-binding cassette domain-containing protein [Candidatus Faecenecus gallistercoris]|nr:ATP-binding cassette domain-containing protein [Bacillota bacterium]MDD7102603.1 ATP-binding cassette domain-containing protein [Bacillota bacterium]MDY4051212.1 ATP-binding cassette domain-containing protein [Candidatus Faecenecus gallistercoris]
MLEIKHIKKSYKTGDFVQKALNDVSIQFRQNEFVAILGPSGSGKTTLLNVLGGLDHYDSGDLIINGKSTKNFKAADWDAYRNNSVGFIFQSYNLIGHISIQDNVEMALTLSNVKKKERRKRAREALKSVGLLEHAHKRPNQLSGGQMQRVAIARSLVNNPDIILADEPTGALDSNTSKQIMDLIQKIASDKLVIMVTHNQDLAYQYATRVIEVKDGKVVSDSNPLTKEEQEEEQYKLKKTKMSFMEALYLSFNNIMTKKGRTLITAFASSIGIIGIALILSLSNGFDLQIDKFERGILSAMPIMISKQSMDLDEESLVQLTGEEQEKYPDKQTVIPKDNALESLVHQNKINDDYIDYIENIPSDLVYGVSYTKMTALNVLTEHDGEVSVADTQDISFSTLPKSLDENTPNAAMEAYYDILAGTLPQKKEDIVLIVDASNRVNTEIIQLLGFDTMDEIPFDKIIGKTIKVALNDDFYVKMGDYFVRNPDLQSVYDNSITLTVSGILRMKEDFPSYVSSASLCYTDELLDEVIAANNESEIVKAQQASDVNVLTGMPFSDSTGNPSSLSSTGMTMTKDTVLGYLGADQTPYMIYLFPKDFERKDELLEYLDAYNDDKEDDDKVIYMDQAELISSMSSSIMSAVTIVLIAFSSISLIVSSIMIGIITYISVLERTKEIGILRALGARKKDISRVFNAETFIIGITSGLIGIGIALILTIPTNQIIYNLTELENVAILNPLHALILILVSMTLTMIGGFIPARIAAKKDPVEALRTE